MNNFTGTLIGPNRCCSKYPVRPSGGFTSICQNKIQFESKLVYLDQKDHVQPIYKLNDAECLFLKSTLRPNSSDVIYYCDWQPKLFGIDEDEIPPSDDEEMFEVDVEELREKAANLTESEIETLREFNREKTDDELREVWVENNIPRYARRMRAKPVLERDHHEEFECICHIDLFYCRHYIPRFSDGVKEGEELRVPHFRAYWEEYRQKTEMRGADCWSDIAKNSPDKPEQSTKEPLRSFFNKSYTKTDVSRLRKKLLASFRPLDCREIRRHRMPFAEALYLELQEDNHQEAALFFKYLLTRDYFVHVAPENTNPTLRQSRGKLLKLIAFLKLAEKYSGTKEFHKEAIILLRTGKYYNDQDENWWWLAEEFYNRAVKVSQKSVIDGGNSEAISRFMLGMYLLDYAPTPELAEEHFSKAIKLSMGKDWTAEKFLNRKSETLYKECVNYLCRVLIMLSEDLRKKGKPNEALPLIHRSYKLCREAKPKRDIEMETYFELGMTYQEVGFLNWAKVAFRKFIELAKEKNYSRRICDGYLEMAICYRRENDLDKCQLNLLNYLRTAEAKKDENLIAYGHQYLGEFYLYNGNSDKAGDYFKKAFSSFCNQFKEVLEVPYKDWKLEHFMLRSNMKLCRALEGLARGEVLTKPICRLILSAKDSKSQEETLKLIQWKNRGEINFRLDMEYEENPMYSKEMWAVLSNVSKVLLQNKMEESNTNVVRTVRFDVETSEIPIIL